MSTDIAICNDEVRALTKNPNLDKVLVAVLQLSENKEENSNSKHQMLLL